jgi:hypothetical protein
MTKLQRFLDGCRGKLLETAVIGVPTAIFTLICDRIAKHVLDSPRQVLWVVLPCALLAWIAWRLAREQPLRKLNWRLLLFCSLYSVIFALASTAQLTAWKRHPVAGNDAAHQSWTSVFPIRWGDWRYRYFVHDPPAPRAPPIALLLIEQPPHANKDQLRNRDVTIIALAKRGNVAGLVFDFIYRGPSDVDAYFCKDIRSFTDKKEDVQRALVTAYEVRPIPEFNRYERSPRSDEQPPCLVQSQQGHAMGLADVDGLVRGIPLFWESPQRKHPALSWQLTTQLKKQQQEKAREPADLFLRILPAPKDAIAIYTSQQTLSQHPDLLSGAILVVGDQSTGDQFHTPFGDVQGAKLHAFAIYDLVNGYALTRPPQWLYALFIIAICTLGTVYASGSASLPRMLIGAAAMTAFILLLSASVMYFLSIWFDAIYPIAAIWLLIPLMLLLRRRHP